MEQLTAYTESLVPKIIRHDTRIVDNQKFLVAANLRKMQSIPFYTRQELCNELVKGIRLTGLSTEVYEFEELLDFVDMDKLVEVLLQ